MTENRPLLIPYHYTWEGKRKMKYVAYCGICGNPIARATSKRFCQFCRTNIDWSGCPTIQCYILTERAISLTNKLI